MNRYGKLVFGLAVAVLFLAMGCKSGRSNSSSHPAIVIGMDANNSIPSCFADVGWINILGNGTVDWTAAPGDSNSYQVQFTGSPYPLTDSNGAPVNAPIVVTSSGTQSGPNKGPFTISSAANYACKASPDAAPCYFSYDIRTNGRSCIQHYGVGFGVYSTGMHIER